MPHSYYMVRRADRFPVAKWLREHVGKSDEDQFYASFLNWCSTVASQNTQKLPLSEGGDKALACLQQYPTKADELLLVLEQYKSCVYHRRMTVKGVVPNWEGEGNVAASDIRAGELALYQKATTFFMRGEHLLIKKSLEEGGESQPLLPKQSTGDKRKYASARKEAAEGLLAMSTRTGGVDLVKNKKTEATLEMADVGDALPAHIEEKDDDDDEQLPIPTHPFNFNNLTDRTR